MQKELTHQEAKEAAKKFIAEKVQQTKAILELSGEVSNTVTILTYYPLEDRIGTVDIPNTHLYFQNEFTKKLLKPMIARTVTTGFQEAAKLTKELTGREFEYQVLAIIIASDSFYYSKPKEEAERENFIKPSQHPDRKEALVFAVSTKEEDFAEIHPYVRVDEMILFEQVDFPNETPGIAGNMVGLYPR